MDVAIKTTGLSKRYHDSLHALQELDLSINQGEIFGFLGHNGAGKTTTLSILTTLLKPSSGYAWINGFDVVKESLQVRHQIGYVPENVRLYPAMSVQDNLRFLARLSGMKQPDKEIEQTLQFLQCDDLAHRKLSTLSKGQRQRIGLAQAILHHPSVLFLDEPTSGLDPAGIRQLRDLIVQLNRERGTTIFMNTHLLSEVSKTCTSIGILSHGQLVFHDTLEAAMQQVGDDTELENLYLTLTKDPSGEDSGHE